MCKDFNKLSIRSQSHQKSTKIDSFKKKLHNPKLITRFKFAFLLLNLMSSINIIQLTYPYQESLTVIGTSLPLNYLTIRKKPFRLYGMGKAFSC